MTIPNGKLNPLTREPTSSVSERTRRALDATITTRLLTSLIVTNVASFIIETTPWGAKHARAFGIIELSSVVIFAVEYLARLAAAPADPRSRGARFARLRWALTPLALIDLLAILPTLLGLGDLRVLRTFRLLRLLKLGRYNTSLQTLGRVLRRTQATLIATLFLVLLALILASSFLYYAEREAQPDAFSSIPASMWWAIATLTTTGFGDVSPITPLGRVLAGITTLVGISVVALPVGILASAFVEELRTKRADDACPHCGGVITHEEAT